MHEFRNEFIGMQSSTRLLNYNCALRNPRRLAISSSRSRQAEVRARASSRGPARRHRRKLAVCGGGQARASPDPALVLRLCSRCASEGRCRDSICSGLPKHSSNRVAALERGQVKHRTSLSTSSSKFPPVEPRGPARDARARITEENLPYFFRARACIGWF